MPLSLSCRNCSRMNSPLSNMVPSAAGGGSSCTKSATCRPNCSRPICSMVSASKVSWLWSSAADGGGLLRQLARNSRDCRYATMARARPCAESDIAIVWGESNAANRSFSMKCTSMGISKASSVLRKSNVTSSCNGPSTAQGCELSFSFMASNSARTLRSPSLRESANIGSGKCTVQ